MTEEILDLETGEIIEADARAKVAFSRPARSRTNVQADALTLAHVVLMENEVLTRSQSPDLFRLVNNQFAALQSWHDQHTGWRIRRSPTVLRLVRVPSALVPGYMFRALREPRDFACFTWTLWYAESRQLAGRGNDQQFLMSQLAEQLEEQSRLGNLAEHVATLDFKKQADRYSLSRALKALQDLGGLQLVDGGADDWVSQTGESDALWEFTEVTRSLMLALEPHRVQVAGQRLDGDPNTLKPALLQGLEKIEPLQRAWRALLLGPSLLNYDDPAAFAALKEHAPNIRHELGETFGWQLDLRREYGCVIRASGTALGPVTLLNLQGAADQAALLCCDVIRHKVTSGDRTLQPDPDGCILIAKGEMAEIFRQVRERYGERWGNTARKAHFPTLLREVYDTLRQAGLMRGPDRNGNILILPTAARFTVAYSREDEEETATLGQPELASQLNLEMGEGETPATDSAAKTGKVKGYTAAEAGRLLGISNTSVLNWIKAGHLKAEQQGRGWFISADEIERVRIRR
ncbi:MAG: TIGR02678 family protein [Chloroflexi bacterium]|nr:TIGR02678 family protein [Chloroflexota bacterium]